MGLLFIHFINFLISLTIECKLKNLVLSYENLGASHEREIYLSPERKYIISAIKQSNTTKLTILIVVQVAFFSELTSSVSPAPASALLIGLYKSMISAALIPPLIRLNGMITGISFTTSALGKPVYIGVTTRFQSDITTVSDKTAHTSDKTAPFVVLFLW